MLRSQPMRPGERQREPNPMIDAETLAQAIVASSFVTVVVVVFTILGDMGNGE